MPSTSSQLFKLKRVIEDPVFWISGINSRFPLGLKHEPEIENQVRASLLIIIPPGQSEKNIFGPGLGNYYFELFKSAEEIFGQEYVATYFLDNSKSFESEVSNLLRVIRGSRIERVLFHIESIDAGKGFWRWDILASALSSLTRKVGAIGFMTDGAYPLHQLFCKRFLDIHSNSCFIQIDRKPDSLYLPDGRLVGPTFLPISNASVDILVQGASGAGRGQKTELTFIGKIYDYRESELSVIQESGLHVEINPQNSGDSPTKAAYGDFFRALVESKFTLNFSRASGVSKPQLKSRMLESRLAGSVPVTDDRELNSVFFDEGRDFIAFESLGEVAGKIGSWTDSGEGAAEWFVSTRFAEVRALAQRNFWDTTAAAIESNAL
jgi:hypothetical protein